MWVFLRIRHEVEFYPAAEVGDRIMTHTKSYYLFDLFLIRRVVKHDYL